MLSGHIGELVMRELKRLDKIAYIRFASVYKSFEDVAEFQDRAPATRPGIARTGAVGMNDDRGKRTHATIPVVVTP